HGWVEWPEGDSVPGLRGEPVPIRVHVNGFEQLEAVLEKYSEARADRRRAFRARIRLNQEACNCVRLQLPPSLKPEASECLDFAVDCGRPETGSRLHLLVIGPGE